MFENANAYSPTDTIELGNHTSARLVIPSNAPSPIVVHPSDNRTEVQLNNFSGE
jgi:hypothetical protein